MVLLIRSSLPEHWFAALSYPTAMGKASAFEEYLWPELLLLGWKLEYGKRPTDKFYLPPGLASRRGLLAL